MSYEARQLLQLTAKAVREGFLAESDREDLDTWIIERDKEANQQKN